MGRHLVLLTPDEVAGYLHVRAAQPQSRKCVAKTRLVRLGLLHRQCIISMLRRLH